MDRFYDILLDMNKKVIMNVESVYTANSFLSGGRRYVAAGSETTSEVYL